MKRILAALLLTAGLAVTSAVPASAEKNFSGDPGSRPCADFNNGTFTYTDDPPEVTDGTPRVFVQIDTQATTCSNTSYTASVYSDPGTGLLGSSNPSQVIQHSDGTSTLEFGPPGIVPTGSPTPTDVCVAVTATLPGGTVLDQAPTTPTGGCSIGAEVVLDGGSGASHAY